MDNEEELRQKIKDLEKQIGHLRAKRKVIVVYEGKYEGHPTINFEGNGNPFAIGLRKAATILYCLEHVKRFVSRHSAELTDWEIVGDANEEGGDGGSRRIQI